MKTFLLFTLSFFLTFIYAQEGFQTIISTNNNLIVNNSLYLDDNYYIIGGSRNENNIINGIIYRLDENGDLVDSLIIYNETLNSTANKAIILNNGLIRVFCTQEKPNKPGFFLLYLLDIDTDLNIIGEKFYDLGTGKMWKNINTIQKGNDILIASIVVGNPPETSPGNWDKLLMKINQNGDLLFDSIYNHTTYENTMGFIEDPNSDNLILYCTTSFEHGNILRPINILDTDFNLIENFYIEDQSPQASISAIDDETFLITCKRSTNKEYWYTSINTYDLNFERENQLLIGSNDSASIPSINNSIVILDSENIFVGSTFNLAITLYPSQKSFFRLDKVNDQLDIKWQKYIGGDAYYLLYDMSETPDGGLMMVGTKYKNGTAGPFKKDIFIIKFNEDELITSNNNNLDIPIKNAIIMPNPGTNHLELHTGIYPSELQLFNMNGQLVISENINKESSRINTQALKSGTYIWYLLKDKELVESGKWLKL